MQAAAAELALSETCFVVPTGASIFSLRWFTPSREVSLCGHGTLAAAHAVWSSGVAPLSSELTFSTLSGDLRVRPRLSSSAATYSNGRDVLAAPAAATSTNTPSPDCDTLATLSLPAHAPLSSLPPTSTLSSLYSALGLSANDVLDTAFDSATGKLIIEVADCARILSLAPTSSTLLAVNQQDTPPHTRVSGVSVTCLGAAHASTRTDDGDTVEQRTTISHVQHAAPSLPVQFSFHSRYFSPWNGLPYAGGEDPANGSSHTVLYPYWARKLGLEFCEAEAIVESRQGGRLWVNYTDATKLCVDITGGATTVCAGEFRLRT